MRAFILSLYANPRAKVRVNGHLSSALSIHSSTRQVCPLSPLLYILTLKPLLWCIRANSSIKAIEVHNKEYKIAAFSDYVLLFLSMSLTSLPNLMPVLAQFKLHLNLKCNYSKSFALNECFPANQTRKSTPGQFSHSLENGCHHLFGYTTSW